MDSNIILKLLGYISPEAILSAIRETFDPGAVCDFQTKDFGACELGGNTIFYRDDKKLISKDGDIAFSFDQKSRRLDYSYQSIISREAMEHYKSLGLGEMAMIETTTLSMKSDDASDPVMMALAAKLGGGWCSRAGSEDSFQWVSAEQAAAG